MKDAAQQLVVNDVTRGNISETSFIAQWMQRIGATDDAMMGSLRQGGPERLTEGEFQGTRTGAVSRLERIARVLGLQAMHPLGYMFASHTQQMMSEETYVKSVGRWEEDLLKEYGFDKKNIKNGRIKVTPWDLSVDYDVMARDGSVPGSNFSEMWVQMFSTIAQYPELQQQFDIARIFMHIGRNLGAKNVQEFIRVVPDEEALREQERGNIQPFPGGGQGEQVGAVA
jgi:hypothetical protein